MGSRLITDIVASRYQEILPRFASGKLLDLGCGRVPLFQLYRDVVSDSVCADWPHSFHGIAHLDCQCDLGDPLPFRDEVFDTLLLSDVLEHARSPGTLFTEIARVLRGDGTLIMNTPFLYWVHEEPHDYGRYTELALRRFAEDAGLEVVILERLGGAPEVLTDIFSKHAQVLPLVGPAIAALSQWLAWLVWQRSPARALSRATAAKFPIGYFLVARRPPARD